MKHKLQAIARSQGLVSDDEKCRETFEESDQNQETSNNIYYSHTSDDLCNASSAHAELNEVITNDIIDTDLSEAEIIKSFEINEKCMTQVDYSQNTNDIDLENMYSVNDDHSVETEIPIHQHSDNMLEIEVNMFLHKHNILITVTGLSVCLIWDQKCAQLPRFTTFIFPKYF